MNQTRFPHISDELLFGEFILTKLSQIRLGAREIFSNFVARLMLTGYEYCKRRRGHYDTAYFTRDRIIFGCGSFRDSLLYREIHGFHQLKHIPTVFTLSIFEEQTGRRFYETYQSETIADVQQIKELIAISTNHPLGIIKVQYPSVLPNSGLAQCQLDLSDGSVLSFASTTNSEPQGHGTRRRANESCTSLTESSSSAQSGTYHIYSSPNDKCPRYSGTSVLSSLKWFSQNQNQLHQPNYVNMHPASPIGTTLITEGSIYMYAFSKRASNSDSDLSDSDCTVSM
ncbi:uncharacterized protein DEA37_0007571 [Paragonimus westermani]|uniref:Trematode PH-like domain-containing protein n=1 Tax=Paragonimus westermani TaxID=34504 RepID=A0A5J4NKB8_9TREM|nr:uncharacterized protein DEA37_0007571 [Paragonimus westermani]